jgi:hypothetical protein
MISAMVSMFISRIQGLSLFLLLFIGFFVTHLSYGFGYLHGIIDFIVLRKHKSKKFDVGLSR